MGAAVPSKVKPAKSKAKVSKVVDATVTFSASYATGGDTFLPGQLGLNRVAMISQPADTNTAAHGAQIVLGGTPSAPTLKVFRGSNAEVAAATNLSTLVVRLQFHGY